ncbi:MAG TPA: hypothetical protein VK953_00355 [Methylophilus sp.]|nr:hypothetical protein [Methylophilus sp.]
MIIRINSDEFKAWHEVGHATVCLHFGGDLDCIEFLEEDARGFAVARGCVVMPDKEQSVASGGFAIEFYLLRAGYISGVDLSDSSEVARVSTLVFSNAWMDRQYFAGRMVTEDNDFTREENESFMHYSVEHVAPIFDLYFERMKLVVNELFLNRKIDGARVRELLQL